MIYLLLGIISGSQIMLILILRNLRKDCDSQLMRLEEFYKVLLRLAKIVEKLKNEDELTRNS